ncbi:hypothetical protein MVI01_50260 [Myxococcus virescens]|uniref:Uncharacterized protein n=1 Tax=Myxococcus virescens TaxID=83456 RepID=A0A511HI51_9BACT|nr:hypothetical protein MVI01_50260 [Myxococcus virescens]
MSVDAPRGKGWASTEARFGGRSGSGSATYAHGRYDAGGTGYIFAVERRAPLALARRHEQGFRSVSPGQDHGGAVQSGGAWRTPRRPVRAAPQRIQPAARKIRA